MTLKSVIAQPSTIKLPTDAQRTMYLQWEKEIEWLNKNKELELEFKIDNCLMDLNNLRKDWYNKCLTMDML